MSLSRAFGRRPSFDPRSRRFPIRAALPTHATPRSYTWACGVWLDQGAEGACTGFATAHEAAALPIVVPGITDATGLEVYRRARQLDEWPGEDYEGSSVLGAVKAAVERGWYREYRWAFSEMDLRLAIGHHGPAIIGVNWYAGFMDPDTTGRVVMTGDVVGGHAICVRGFNVRTGLYRLRNSWGRAWGLFGDCFLSTTDMARLLREDGEACIPVRRSVTAS